MTAIARLLAGEEVIEPHAASQRMNELEPIPSQ